MKTFRIFCGLALVALAVLSIAVCADSHGVAAAVIAANAVAPPLDIGALARKFDQNFQGLKEAIEAAGVKAADTATKQTELGARIVELEQYLTSRRGGDGRGGGHDQSAGALVIDHADFKAFGGSRKRGKFAIEVKTITTALNSGGALIAPHREQGIVMLPQQRLTVRDLLAPGRTGSSSVEYPRQTIRTNNADVVTEGATKPESHFAFELRTAPVRTIAHWTKASKQALDDAPMLQSTIDGELRYGLKLKEEDELLYGDGTGQHLFGIVPQATAFSSPIDIPDSVNRFDVLLMAIAQTELALLPATGIVLNDLDLTAMQAIKDVEGRYVVSGGPFAGPITTIWDRPVVGTPSMQRGEFLCGAFRDGAQIFDRWDAQVIVSTENEDDFIKNLCTVLGEERLALAVKRPQAFVTGEFDSVTGVT